MTTVDCVAPDGCTIGESPIWDDKRQPLAGALFALRPGVGGLLADRYLG